MSNDSGLFRTREQLEADGFKITGNRFTRSDDDAQDVLQETVITVAKKLGVNVGLVYLAKHRISALLKKEIKVLETKTV